MSNIPSDLRFTAEHEWVQVNGSAVRIGITDFAQAALGDVVYVSLPELGATVARGDAFGEVESTKSVSDVFAPLDGSVATRNDKLEANPELVNSDPYGEGWIVELTLTDPGQLDELLDADAYRTLTDGS